MDLDKTLCYCFHVKKRKIVNFVKQTRPPRASQIAECFSAGTGCGWCIPFLRRIHRQVMAGEAVESGDIGTEEYEAMREAYREDIKAGRKRPNTQAEVSEPYRAPPTPAPVGEPGKVESEDSDWDVSDYFSKTKPPDPEPDTL